MARRRHQVVFVRHDRGKARLKKWRVTRIRALTKAE